MSDNASSRVPAWPTIVREFILEILQFGEPLKRAELVARVRRLAPKRGFVLEAAAAIPAVKKALSVLADEHRVIRPRTGYWKIQDNAANADGGRIAELRVAADLLHSTSNEEESSQPEPNDSAADNRLLQARLIVERQIGEGPESVYVYYHDAHADLARLHGQSVGNARSGGQ
jgi:hypothetical protein